jgi:pyridinium-3,5-bisthiocarboxylic acid mononucleotide nickel chelatase
MRIGYLECFAGISGDMFMGALVDAGASVDLLQRTAASLGLGAELRVTRVSRSGIQSTKIDVMVDGQLHEPAALTGPVQYETRQEARQEAGHGHPHDHPHSHGHGHHHEHPAEKHQHPRGQPAHGRSLQQIRSLLQHADLTQRARTLSMKAFDLLAQAEGHIHGVPAEEVHFHEVGAVDAIVDIACCAAAADALDVDGWYCSPINVGSGFVNCAHGRFPVPAPATAELLRNLPTYSAHVQMELVTPTGAALLCALECSFDSLGVLRTQTIGYGAGTRDPDRFPNVLRVNIGVIAEQGNHDKVTVLECAVDDLSPQVLAHTAQLAMEAGALDVMSAPVTMKKGRLGTLLTVLCKAGDASRLQQLIFRETTTLGIRVREESRVILARQVTAVKTEFGVIPIKTGSWMGELCNAAPEFEDCRRAAAAFDVPLKAVMQAAMAAWGALQLSRVKEQSGSPLEAGSRS